jgi:hypothetical protein
MELINIEKKFAYAVMNPLGEQEAAESAPPAKRLAGLNGKVVYCVSQIIMGSEIFIEKVASLLPRYAPGVKVKSVRKPAAYMTDDPVLWDEIASEADAVIYGCGA